MPPALLALLTVMLLLAGCGGHRTGKGGQTATPVVSGTGTPGGSGGANCANAPKPTGHGPLKGIYQFTGAPQVNNPALNGGVVIRYWADIEPAEGQYNWSSLDAAIAQWTSVCKKVIVRIPFASSNDPTGSPTPQWVYDAGVPKVVTGNGTVYPVYWNSTFLAKLKNFITAFGARYDGNPNILYVNAATGNDGETIVEGKAPGGQQNGDTKLQAWQAAGYSDALWFSTIQQIWGFYTSAFHHTPLAVQVDETFIGGTPGYNTAKALSAATSARLWLQNDGEYPGHRPGEAQWFQTTLILEPGQNSKQQGQTLAANLQNMVSLGATYALVFGSDLSDPANQQALATYAAQVSP